MLDTGFRQWLSFSAFSGPCFLYVKIHFSVILNAHTFLEIDARQKSEQKSQRDASSVFLFSGGFSTIERLHKSIVFIWLEGESTRSSVRLSSLWFFFPSKSVSISPSVFISLSLILTDTGAETWRLLRNDKKKKRKAYLFFILSISNHTLFYIQYDAFLSVK